MEEKRNSAEEEAMNNLVKAVLKSGDVKTVFDVEDKLKKSFGKIIQEMLEAEMTEQNMINMNIQKEIRKTTEMVLLRKK